MFIIPLFFVSGHILKAFSYIYNLIYKHDNLKNHFQRNFKIYRINLSGVSYFLLFVPNTNRYRLPMYFITIVPDCQSGSAISKE
jgi:hypothetical protein